MVQTGAFLQSRILLGSFHVNKVEELLKTAPSAESARAPSPPVPEVNFSTYSDLNPEKPPLPMLSCEPCPQKTLPKPGLTHVNVLKVPV